MVSPEQDRNHLLVTCCIESNLAGGLRYAYYRLDTIDRKASEVGRSVGFLLTIIIALCSFERESIIKGLAAGTLPARLLLISVTLFLLVSLAIAFYVAGMSRLRFFRFDRASTPVENFIGVRKLTLYENNLIEPSIDQYIAEMSAVTLDRERRLWFAGNLYYLSLISFRREHTGNIPDHAFLTVFGMRPGLFARHVSSIVCPAGRAVTGLADRRANITRP